MTDTKAKGHTKGPWRNEDEVVVGWVGQPELGFLRCEVIERWPNPINEYRNPHPVKAVRWANGAVARVTWCHSEERYVWLPIHPTATFVHRGSNPCLPVTRGARKPVSAGWRDA